MDKPSEEDNLINNTAFKAIRHDIKNQLSNIHLSVEQLRYEVPELSAEILFYLDTISMSCNKINSIIKGKE